MYRAWPSEWHCARRPVKVIHRPGSGCEMAGFPRPLTSVHAGLGKLDQRDGDVPETGTRQSRAGLDSPPPTADRARRDLHRPTRGISTNQPSHSEMAPFATLASASPRGSRRARPTGWGRSETGSRQSTRVSASSTNGTGTFRDRLAPVHAGLDELDQRDGSDS